jgi:hypothetical protein
MGGAYDGAACPFHADPGLPSFVCGRAVFAVDGLDAFLNSEERGLVGFSFVVG